MSLTRWLSQPPVQAGDPRRTAFTEVLASWGPGGMLRTQCEVLDVGKYSHPSYFLVVKH